MTKKGYTHVLIPKILHSVLKENAKNGKTSVWRYINDLIRRDSQARYGAGLLTLCSHKELGGSSPPLVAYFSDKQINKNVNIDCNGNNTKDFEKFLCVQKNLSDLITQSDKC